MEEIKPDRNYFVGWYYAFKWLIPKLTVDNFKHKTRLKLFIKGWFNFIKQKTFWYSPEQLQKRNEIEWDNIRQNIKLPSGFGLEDYRKYIYYDNDYDDED